MPFNPYSRKPYEPDQFQAAMPMEGAGWQDLGDDQVNIDAGPAASAFKQRFMNPRPVAKIDTPPLPHGGGMPMAGHEASPMMKGPKSL